MAFDYDVVYTIEALYSDKLFCVLKERESGEASLYMIQQEGYYTKTCILHIKIDLIFAPSIANCLKM